MQWWRPSDSKIWWGSLKGWRFREELEFDSKGSPLAEFLLAWGREVRVSVFVLLRPPIEWGPPTLWKVIYFTQIPPIKMLTTPKETVSQKHQNIVDQISRQGGSDKLTPKINHRSCVVFCNYVLFCRKFVKKYWICSPHKLTSVL